MEPTCLVAHGSPSLVQDPQLFVDSLDVLDRKRRRTHRTLLLHEEQLVIAFDCWTLMRHFQNPLQEPTLQGWSILITAECLFGIGQSIWSQEAPSCCMRGTRETTCGHSTDRRICFRRWGNATTLLSTWLTAYHLSASQPAIMPPGR